MLFHSPLWDQIDRETNEAIAKLERDYRRKLKKINRGKRPLISKKMEGRLGRL